MCIHTMHMTTHMPTYSHNHIWHNIMVQTKGRSVFGTFWFPNISFCPKCATDWKTLYGFTRKIVSLSLFLLLAAALSPLYIRSQSNAVLQVKMEDMQARLDGLSKIPEEVAMIRVQMESLRMDVTAIKTDQKDEAAWLRSGIVAMLGFFLMKLLEPFGIVLGFGSRGREGKGEQK